MSAVMHGTPDLLERELSALDAELDPCREPAAEDVSPALDRRPAEVV